MQRPMKNTLTSLCLVAALGGGALLTGCANHGNTPSNDKSAGEVVDDAWITTKVKAAFVEDPTVKALDIKVDTFKGVVQLSGFANSSAEMARAAEIARGIKGVKSVKNDVRLKSAQG